jgi:hypothetical protein
VSLQFVPIVEMARVYEGCARILGRSPTALTPDAIAAIVERVDWRALPEWESKSDADIATEAGVFRAAWSGPLLVVTEASFVSRGAAFLLEANELRLFVSEHLARYDECFFNGDVIIVECRGHRIWLFHHEGEYAMLSGLRVVG